MDPIALGLSASKLCMTPEISAETFVSLIACVCMLFVKSAYFMLGLACLLVSCPIRRPSAARCRRERFNGTTTAICGLAVSRPRLLLHPVGKCAQLCCAHRTALCFHDLVHHPFLRITGPGTSPAFQPPFAPSASPALAPFCGVFSSPCGRCFACRGLPGCDASDSGAGREWGAGKWAAISCGRRGGCTAERSTVRDFEKLFWCRSRVR